MNTGIGDAIACLREVHQLGVALDTNAQLFEVRDQQSLVFVLRVEQPVRKGCGDRAQLAELDVRRPLASRPQIRGGEPEAGGDHLVGETELAVELQRPRLHR